MKAEPRRTPPLGVQLAAAKRQIVELMQRLGLIPADVAVDAVKLECDHDPALGLRDVCPETGCHIPHQHDPACLVFRPDDLHGIKTRGTGASTATSDIGEMRKTRQLVRKRIARGDADPADPAIAPWAPDPTVERRPKPPKRAWASRPFPAGRSFPSRSDRKAPRP